MIIRYTKLTGGGGTSKATTNYANSPYRLSDPRRNSKYSGMAERGLDSGSRGDSIKNLKELRENGNEQRCDFPKTCHQSTLRWGGTWRGENKSRCSLGGLFWPNSEENVGVGGAGGGVGGGCLCKALRDPRPKHPWCSRGATWLLGVLKVPRRENSFHKCRRRRRLGGKKKGDLSQG